MPDLIPGFPLGTREENIRLAAQLLDTFLDHGSRGSYNRGCHCDWCREAARQYEAAYYERADKTKKAAARRAKRRQFEAGVLADEEGGEL